MTLEFLQYLCVFALWGLSIVLMYILGKMDHSLYKVFVRSVFYRDVKYWNWMKEHIFYLWMSICVVSLIIMSLGLLSQIYNGTFHLRKEGLTFNAVIAWSTIATSFYSLYTWAHNKKAPENTEM